jgi:calcineurin-like phosphoesterase family protein
MRHFITSDIHFGHKNILKYNPATRGQYASADDMNIRFIDNFNNQVTENDHTYILGDIGFCKPEQTMEFLKQMNGLKTIIHGNHDVPHPGSKHPEDSLTGSMVFQNPEQRRLAGIIEDTPYKVISHMVDGARYGIILFHFRIASWDGAHHGSIHFYGHEHGNGPVIDARCMDIGVDTNNMNPYLLDSAVRLVCKKDKVVSGHHDGTR